MQLMNLKNAYLRVSVETKEQLSGCIKMPGAELIYIDSGYFPPETWKDTVKMIHKGSGGIGKMAGLRFPHIFRTEAEKFFSVNRGLLSDSGFDLFLVRNMETALFIKEELPYISPEMLVFDHTVYSFNSQTDEVISEITGFEGFTGTYAAELSDKEIKTAERLPGIKKELVVYGRVPMMVTAQCLRKTSLRCDRRMCEMQLKDRTGAFMPVKNCCTFCYNTVLNSVPTCLYDLSGDIDEIAPDFIRYEFTVEKEHEVKNILSGKIPAGFTRGHFRKSVQ